LKSKQRLQKASSGDFICTVLKVDIMPETPFQEEMAGRLTRRGWLLRAAGAGLAALVPAGCQRAGLEPEGASQINEELLRFPGKVPMRALNGRPPCLETPWRYFQEDLTPNEAFYVRWHLQMVPTTIDLRTWRLRLGGEVRQPLELSLDELRGMPAVSVVAVNQCSGNSRGLFEPHMPGAQWGNGAMGNARWTGVPLKKVLERAGLKESAKEVTFLGLDKGGLPSVPDYVKSLPLGEVLDRKLGGGDADILLAYEMNGQPLPLLNGFPLRLVVPGWYATWWVKSLTDITVVAKPFDGFWVSKAYRIPTTPNGVEEPAKLAEKTVPINRMNVRSFFTSPGAGASVPVGTTCPLEGIAFDGGAGIRRVELSADGGATWQDAELGTDHGRFSFRRWRFTWQPPGPGRHTLRVKATSNSDEVQPAEPGWNRSGYMRNVIEALEVAVV
jgi:sulfite dehydrogenase (cytochrome) subunit A